MRAGVRVAVSLRVASESRSASIVLVAGRAEW